MRNSAARHSYHNEVLSLTGNNTTFLIIGPVLYWSWSRWPIEAGHRWKYKSPFTYLFLVINEKMYNWTHWTYVLDGPGKTSATPWPDSGSDVFVASRTQNNNILEPLQPFRVGLYKSCRVPVCLFLCHDAHTCTHPHRRWAVARPYTAVSCAHQMKL